jgi:hypothetical protein
MTKGKGAAKNAVKVKGSLILKGAKAPSQLSKKQKKRKNMSAGPAVGNLVSDGGALSEMKAHALSFTNSMQAASPISDTGKSSIMTILNPCGELGSDENAKFPDGTLSQSGVQRFRQFETIVAPWQTASSSSNVTNNWSLYLISPAAFRTIAVMIAVRDGSALSDEDFVQVFEVMNTDTNMINYPDWGHLGASLVDPAPTPNIYYSTYSFRSANLNIDPSTGESTTIESFRVVGDGMVVMHNTPDLWNQGSFAVGQFKTDFNLAETDTTGAPVVVRLEVGVRTPTTLEGNINIYGLRNPVDGTESFFAIPLSGAGPWSGTMVSGGEAFSISEGPPGDQPFGTNGSAVTVTYQVGGTPNRVIIAGDGGYQIVFDLEPIGVPPTTYTSMMQGTGAHFVFEGYNPSQLVWSLPALNQDAIAQADPKFSAELMKSHCGFYAVRRYFEPVLNMNNSNVSGNIKMEVSGMDKMDVIQSPGGIQNDILDRNGATIVAAIRGISYACSPTIKSVRFIEFMPSANSSLAPFVGPTPPKDADAVEVFRQFQESGPHSFIPDANFLGGLATFIMGVVEAVPVFLRTARGISGAVVKALDWVESKIPVM